MTNPSPHVGSADASRRSEETIADVGKAVGFLVAHNLEVCGALRPSIADTEASMLRIRQVVDIMRCTYVELAVMFGMKRYEPRGLSASEEPCSEAVDPNKASE